MGVFVFLKLFFGGCLLVVLSSCSHTSVESRTPDADGGAFASDGLPGSADDLAFLDLVNTLDLERSDIEATVSSGGSSIYLALKIPNADGSSIRGAFLTTNEATNPETEMAAYQTGRLIGRSELFGPGKYKTAGPQFTARFKHIVESNNYSKYKGAKPRNYNLANDTLKEKNRVLVLNQINSNPQALDGIFKLWTAIKPTDCDQLVLNNRLVSNTQIASFIKADGRAPTNAMMTLPCSKGVPQSQLVLAKQLSTIFLVDAITGQYDRFSGGNLQILIDKNKNLIQFAAMDNGGASLSESDKHTTDVYLPLVSRFEKSVVDELRRLDLFLSGKSASYLNFTRPEDLMAAVGIKPRTQSHFRKKLGKVLAHIAAIENKFGAGRVYFQESSKTPPGN